MLTAYRILSALACMWWLTIAEVCALVLSILNLTARGVAWVGVHSVLMGVKTLRDVLSKARPSR